MAEQNGNVARYQTIEVETRGGVLSITLNRPAALNAITAAMHAELNEVVGSLAATRSVRALLIQGAGASFCAGADTGEMLPALAQGGARERLAVFAEGYRWVRQLLELELPVVTAVQGHAAGAGFSIALYGDVVVAAENARFTAAFTRIGLVPDMGGLHLLPRVVGLRRAKELLLGEGKLDAAQAKDWGIVSQITTIEALSDTAWQIAGRLADGPTLAYGLTKVALDRSLDSSLADNLAAERMLQQICLGTKDFREGVDALRDRRPPAFIGG